MLIDLSVKITRKTFDEMRVFAEARRSAVSEIDLFGHIGTHFDIMDKEFSMDNCERKGILFDVSDIERREIDLQDVDLSNTAKNDFVLFHTGTLKKYGYGTPDYFEKQPELSWDLIKFLAGREVSMIGIDAGGLRLTAEHQAVDRYCAGSNVFVVENLDNLDELWNKTGNKHFDISVYPMNLIGATGLPCRVAARLNKQQI